MVTTVACFATLPSTLRFNMVYCAIPLYTCFTVTCDLAVSRCAIPHTCALNSFLPVVLCCNVSTIYYVGAALEKLARKLEGREYFLDPRLFNSTQMRHACIPSANGHFTGTEGNNKYTNMIDVIACSCGLQRLCAAFLVQVATSQVMDVINTCIMTLRTRYN